MDAASRIADLDSSVIRDILRLTQGGDVLSLAGGLPAPESFPRERVSAVTADLAPADLQYAPTEGLDPLRAWIATRLRAAGRDLDLSDVLVTTGSQQALALIATALVNPGDRVALDDPGYLGAIQAFTPAQPQWVPAAVDDDGLDPDVLAAVRVPARFVYTVTESSNPAGATMTPGRRQALAGLVEATGAVVVEDRAYDGLAFEERPVAPSIGTWTDRVLTVGTTSKVLAPGLRVGWVAGPPDLIEPIRRVKQAMDLHTSTLSQRIVLDLVADDTWFRAHVRAVAARHRERAAALTSVLDERLGGALRLRTPTGGMFVWGTVAAGGDCREWLRHAVEHGVAFVPGAAFGATVATRRRLASSLRLSFATLPAADIAMAGQRLAASYAAWRGVDRRDGAPAVAAAPLG